MKILLSALLLASSSALAAKIPVENTERLASTPNVCQSCLPNDVKWGGKPHCGPAAAVNSLLWMANNGFHNLHVFFEKDESLAEAKLIDLLGDHMKTNPAIGTPPANFMTGLKSFLDERKVKFKSLAMQGSRSVPEYVRNDGKNVSLDWIKEGSLGKNSVWLLIGWYHRSKTKDTYDVFAGHWVTVVGYGKNEKGELDPNYLIIHDPAERSKAKQHYYVKVETLNVGTQADPDKLYRQGFPQTAKGVLRLGKGLVYKETATDALVQGAYRLEM